MSGEKRYVTYHSCGQFAAITEGERQSQCPPGYCKTYELGDEVKEPDYTKLVEWVEKHRNDPRGLSHVPGCLYFIAKNDYECTCGLADALKAAGL